MIVVNASDCIILPTKENERKRRNKIKMKIKKLITVKLIGYGLKVWVYAFLTR